MQPGSFNHKISPALASAPGKTILFGEHSVVFGKTAVATSVNLRSYALLIPSTNACVTLNMPDIDLTVSVPVNALNEPRQPLPTNPTPVSDQARTHLEALISKFYSGVQSITSNQISAAVAVFYLLGCLCVNETIPPLSLLVRSEIPIGSGLGSSASFSVALITTLLQGFGVLNSPLGGSGPLANKSMPDLTTPISKANHTTSPLDLINAWAFVAEMIIHGNPSGVDNSIVTFGGALSYTKSQGMQKIYIQSTLEFLLVDSQVQKDTKVQLNKVRTCYDLIPTVIAPILEAMDQIAITGCEVLSSSDSKTLSELIRVNHSLLSALNTSHTTLDKIVSQCQTHGFSAKLTGAGGGGCALVFLGERSVPDEIHVHSLQASLSKYQVFRTQVGGSGVRVHHLDVWPHTSSNETVWTWETVFAWMKDQPIASVADVVSVGHEVCWAK